MVEQTMNNSLAANQLCLFGPKDGTMGDMLKSERLNGTYHRDEIPQAAVAHRRSRMSADAASGPTTVVDAAVIYRELTRQDWAFSEDDTRYLTHDLHPYPAKFIPQIPAHLIASLSLPGDLVFDPFGGSATTAVETVRLRRRAVSLDANPLSALLGRVKTGVLSADARSELDQLHATVEAQLSGTTNRSFSTNRCSVYVPPIPNIDRWFQESAIAELALLRLLIEQTTNVLARDVAYVALSRIVTRVSNQESETRYVAEPSKVVPKGLALRAFQESLRSIVRRMETAAPELQYADATFLDGDARYDISEGVGECTVDLIVSSPPYPNATDYHLYHRFRLFWLGFDPRKFGQREIGSHLRHQRNGSGFEEYRTDMHNVLASCFRVLQPGRYAAFVIGDALFSGKIFSGADALSDIGSGVGFTVVGSIERPIHNVKRSFVHAARRARLERILLLQKPNDPVAVLLEPPGYKMWPYEARLRAREIEALTGNRISGLDARAALELRVAQPAIWNLRRLTFTREAKFNCAKLSALATWQKVLENGDGGTASRKDPKYACHGLHPYKGKFYPQLAKALINISGVPVGGTILDPFCGSGTVLLEGFLNGFAAFGCDLHPLAVKIARGKTRILAVSRAIVEHAIVSTLELMERRHGPLPRALDQFPEATHDELARWFPLPVLHKMNWLLNQVRLFGDGAIVDFFELIISSFVREISQQEPTDLRIRRRKEPLADAPALEMFVERLQLQHKRLRKYWAVAGRQPGPLIAPQVREGDSRRHETFARLGLKRASVDCVITSPPYATALPYIDTDRLSLLAIMGIPATVRTSLEGALTGSREIKRRTKTEIETALLNQQASDVLPGSIVRSVRKIHAANAKGDVGFRRDNMAALLWRYFLDMRENLNAVSELLKPDGKAYYVVGDSRTRAGNIWTSTETCKHIRDIAENVGLRTQSMTEIDVSTENYKHIRNAITENIILEFAKA